MMLDSTVVCRRALGCEWGEVLQSARGIRSAGDQVIREDPAGAVVVRAWPGHRNIGRGSA